STGDLQILNFEYRSYLLFCRVKTATMINRRKFIRASAFTSFASLLTRHAWSANGILPVIGKPIVVSTWSEGLNANKAAWEVLGNNGRALDAVEKGVMDTESRQNCCVGLGANPDRDGFVT